MEIGEADASVGFHAFHTIEIRGLKDRKCYTKWMTLKNRLELACFAIE